MGEDLDRAVGAASDRQGGTEEDDPDEEDPAYLEVPGEAPVENEACEHLCVDDEDEQRQRRDNQPFDNSFNAPDHGPQGARHVRIATCGP